MALTRDEVVDAAVRLLAEGGLEGLTLRRLARDLGVSAPTLYWHVADKRTLLDHVATRLLADQWSHTTPAPGQPWWEWLRERSLAQYRVLVGHRDAALVVAGNRPTPEALPHTEDVLGVLVDAGFSPLEGFRALIGLGHYIIGSAVEYHAELARPSDEHPPPDPEQHPLLATVAQALADGAGEPELFFLEGLDLMIDGMRQHVHRAATSRLVANGQGSPTDDAAVSAT